MHVVQLNLPGLQLGDVEDLVDQRQQFITGAVDGLHVVTLLYRQRRAEQQLGHAEHTVHGRADFVADLRQELGLGGDLGVAGRQVTAEAEAGLDNRALAFAQGQAHQQAAEADKPEQGDDQTLRRHQCQAEQGREDDQCADVEHHHRHHEQACRPVAFLPVIGRDKQHAQPGEGHQGVGDDVQRQGVDEQQQQAAQHDQQDVGHQQLVQRVRAQGHEESVGKHQPAGRGQQQGQVGARGLDRVPVRQPRPHKVEQQRQAQHQQQLAGRQPQAAARAVVSEASEVVQDQHQQAAEQQAIDQCLGLIGGGEHGRFQGDIGAQFVFRDQAQINVQWLLALGHRQHEIAAGQRALRLGLAGAGALLFHQGVAVQYIEAQLGQVRGEYPQHLLVLAGLQLEAYPQRTVRLCSGNPVQFDGAELIGVAGGANVAQLQVGLFIKQDCPTTALCGGLGREQAEQGQQTDCETYGDPEPAHGEIPS